MQNLRIYLAPMEGITTFLYRNAFQRHYGGIDKYFTPFLSNKNLDYKDINDVSPEHNKGIPLTPQILTNRADTFLSIAARLADFGYSEVNLNLGCPSGTVAAKKRGAGFLGVPDLLDAFLDEIFEKCPLKISVKTRIGVSSLEEWAGLIAVYSKYPLSELIIHPRLQQEFYKGKPHPDAFRWAQEALSGLSVPLCYNGDITSEDSLETLRSRVLPVDTVMIGRGAIADPALPRLLKKESPARGDCAKAGDLKTFQAFHDEILEGYIELMSGEQPVLFRMKELWAYMGKHRNLSDRQLKQLRKAGRLTDYRAIVRSIFEEPSAS